MVNSIIILAIIVLPGWLSISAAQLHHPRLIDRTGVMLWGMLFYHAAVVHAIGIAVSALLIFALPGCFLETLRIQSILTDGAYAFASEYPGAALALFGGYSLWMVVASVISGIVDLPAKFTYGLGWLLRKSNLTSEPVNEAPVWYRALHLARKEAEDRAQKEIQVFVSIRMKNGDVYEGALISYPLNLPDSQEAKDIKLGKAILYPNGDHSSPVELDFSDEFGGGVLLNTANISSIQYIFLDGTDRETSG